MLHTISNDLGVEVTLCNFGARVHAILCPDRLGNIDDIVLGCESPEDYALDDFLYFGATVGRYANRIGGASFEINGKSFDLDQNENTNCLHGGHNGFHKKFWKIESADQSSVQYSLLSVDGENGFPGTVKIMLSYTLNANKLSIKYTGVSNQLTHINLTNHSYFNLSGNHNKNILNHLLYINSDKYLSINGIGIPLNEAHLDDDPSFDFREQKPVGTHISNDHVQLQIAGGYDHNYIIRDHESPAAVLIDPISGRQLMIYTSEPGIQFFSGNIEKTTAKGKNNVSYERHAGLCLEPQHYPDSPNNPEFPSTLLDVSEVYRSETIFEFKTN